MTVNLERDRLAVGTTTGLNNPAERIQATAKKQ